METEPTPHVQRTFAGIKTRCYSKWLSMMNRCYNKSHPAYFYYGFRGVAVCERWKKYDNFHADMGEPPRGMWIDRIDNTRGYEPGNCRWVTPKQSAANRGKTGAPVDPDSLRQKAKRAGLPYMVVYQRVKIMRWPEERALSTPKAERLTLKERIERELKRQKDEDALNDSRQRSTTKENGHGVQTLAAGGSLASGQR